MIGIVVVSHSARLAEGAVELARQMGGDELKLEAAGGLEDGSIGTDAMRVLEAMERARSDDGVLVLMDLGSALLSADMALSMWDGPRVVLSQAPIVEGVVAAAVSARGGAALDEVEAEARAAVRMKVAQLGGDDPPAADTADDPAAADTTPGDPPAADTLRFVLTPAMGLHARPAGRFVGALAGLDARVRVRAHDASPADGRSLAALLMLQARQGDEVTVTASGPDAAAALERIQELADAHFGEPPDTPVAPVAPEPAPAAPVEPGGVLHGVAAASGIAIGPVVRLGRREVDVDVLPVGSADEERARLEAALAATRRDLAAAKASVLAGAGSAEAAIFDAHAAMLDDAALIDPAHEGIRDGRGAARAWQAAAATVASMYRCLEDPYLRERAIDVDDVAGRVVAHLAAGHDGGGEAASAGGGGGDARVAAPGQAGIVVADELTPGDAAGLDRSLVRGIATARGGATAHAAILARALGIPAVVGLGPALLTVPEGVTLALDGDAGTVEVDPDPDRLAEEERRREEASAALATARKRTGEPGALADGTRIEVFANAGTLADVAPALEDGAEGIGLLRTEFLFLDRRTPPTEDEQVQALTAIAEALGGRRLIVRTLDAGADKPLPFLPQEPEENPFLGVRGIRLALRRPEILQTQLCAIAKVAQDHPVAVMFPMVTTLEELEQAREHLPPAAALEVGVMVEVPATALAAGAFAPHVDFFSIGTNDLAQYTMAAERGSAALAPLLAGPLPPVLKLIGEVTAAAERHGRWVGVCGELAGDPEAAVLLVGLGVRELSMAGMRIPAVKAALREVTADEARDRAAAALASLGSVEA